MNKYSLVKKSVDLYKLDSYIKEIRDKGQEINYLIMSTGTLCNISTQVNVIIDPDTFKLRNSYDGLLINSYKNCNIAIDENLIYGDIVIV